VLALSVLAVSVLGLAAFVKRSSTAQSILLISVLGIMLYESVGLIAGWLHVELFHSIIAETQGVRPLFASFFELNAVLAIAGVIAAFGFLISLEFRRSHLPLARLFPEMAFAKAPIQLINSVQRLSSTAGIQPPKVKVIDSGDPAAFITRSRNGYVLAVSVGLLESLNTDELDACLAHELAHLRNKDFTVRSFATVAKVALFTHPLSYLIEPAVYRAREMLADRTASNLVGGRSALISALSKLRETQDYLTTPSNAIGEVCLFGSSSCSRFSRLFDKHPTLDARIRALQEM
jgi:heat shock protein HtpX